MICTVERSGQALPLPFPAKVPQWLGLSFSPPSCLPSFLLGPSPSSCRLLPDGHLDPAPKPGPSACGLQLARGLKLHKDFSRLGGISPCGRLGLARMPLAAQLFQALGDTGLRTGWGRPRLFTGMSGSQETRGGGPREERRCEGSDTGFLLVLRRLLAAESQVPCLEILLL